MSVIKWDESMIVRCLAKCPNADAVSLPQKDSSKLVQKTTRDIQWDDFEKALNKALKG